MDKNNPYFEIFHIIADSFNIEKEPAEEIDCIIEDVQPPQIEESKVPQIEKPKGK
jgi:hypothetical protein